MDPIKKSKLRYLSLLSKTALLRIFCTWRTRIKLPAVLPTLNRNSQLTKSITEKKFMNSDKPANSEKFVQYIENSHAIRPKLQLDPSLVDQNNTKKSIFEEIKASLKTKAKNSRVIQSPFKHHTDSFTEISECIARARHKRSNTQLFKLSPSESDKPSQSIYN